MLTPEPSKRNAIVLAVASQKGGVGKTTTSLNLAFALAKRGWKTLIVDCDPQGAVGFSLRKGQTAGEQGLMDCLQGRATLDEAILKTRLPELSILTFGSRPSMSSHPSGDFLEGDELTALLTKAVGHFEVILLDTAGGTYGPTLSVLKCADFALLPLQAEPLALRSVTQILDLIGHLRQKGSRLQIAGFLLTMLNDQDETSVSVAEEISRLIPQDLILNGNVPRDDAFLRASRHGVPVGLLSRRPPQVAAVFDLIAHEVERRIGLIRMEEADEPIPLLD